MENASDILYTLTTDGRFAYVSPSWTTALGFSSDEAVGRQYSSFVHPDDLPRCAAAFTDTLSGAPFGAEVEYRIRHKDGSWRWHAARGSRMMLEGQPVFSGIGRDVTERKRAEEALRASEERHRLLADHAHDVIWTMSVDGRITYVSPAVEGMRGITAEEAMRQPLHEIHPPASAAVSAGYFARLQERLQAGLPPEPFKGELEYYRSDGSTIWTEVQVIPHVGAEGELIELLGVTRDISERRAAAEAVNRRLKDLDALAQLSGLLVRRFELGASLDAACDLLVTVFEARAAAVHLIAGRVGLGAEELDFGDTDQPDGAEDGAMVEALTGRRLVATSCADGSRLLAVPLIADGETIGVLVIVGIRAGGGAAPAATSSSREERSLALTAADLLAAVVRTEYLHRLETRQAAASERQRIARDLHDAVTQSIYSASLIAEVIPQMWERDPEQGHEELLVVRRLVRAALAELRILLYELRPEALATASLETLLQRLADALAGHVNTAVDVLVDPTLDLPADVKATFYRVAQEALNNVGKYAQAAHAEVVLAVDADLVRLTVRDDGVGFAPGATRVGMGLTIMRERAAVAGAEVRIESAPGAGTVVTMTWRPGASAADGPRAAQ